MLKQEKRMGPRMKVRWPVTMLTPQAQVEGKVENVSSKGAFVSCKDMPPLEEGFLLVIRAPDYKSMNLNGRVVWSTVLSSSEDGSQFGIGVQFTRMTAEDRKALHKMIAVHYGLETEEKAGRS
jgi:Tfp pilus assembly protein PilZ